MLELNSNLAMLSSSLGYEGMAPSWGLILMVAASVICIWTYKRYAPGLGKTRKFGLISLRLLVLCGLIILLIKPVAYFSSSRDIRQKVIVLVDDSESMKFRDQRREPSDVGRLAIAKGTVSPKTDPARHSEKPGEEISRSEIFQKVAGNPKLNLFPRLAEMADLLAYRFGSDLDEIGSLAPDKSSQVTVGSAVQLLGNLQTTGYSTAIGNAIRDVIGRNEGSQAAAIFLITDGAGNAGIPISTAIEAARLAKVPIYAYGIGVTKAPDLIIRGVDIPRLAFVGESAHIKVRYVAQELPAGTSEVLVKVDGSEIGREQIKWNSGQEGVAEFSFVPRQAGLQKISVETAALKNEASLDNNKLTADLNAIDTRVRILYIEERPRWDYRYLLAVLQADKRFLLKCVLLDGDQSLQSIQNSPFLQTLPPASDQKAYFENDIILLGDVDPARLGTDRMQLLAKWVEEIGGGLIFLAGPRHNPFSYENTPLEPVLPVVPLGGLSPEQRGEVLERPMRLQLTESGQRSAWLRLAEDRDENLRIWSTFSEMDWIARTGGAKAGAEVALIDPRSASFSNGMVNPVLARHRYGKGEAAYFGTDETYKWRSRQGGKYHITIWGQVLQGLAMQRLLGASYRTQLSASRQEYSLGDKVEISGRIFTPDFQPNKAAKMSGILKVKTDEGTTDEKEIEITAASMGNGEYSYAFVARQPGIYTLATRDDPNAEVSFTVGKPNAENMETALNSDLLRQLAEGTNGKFLREEDLYKLPELIQPRKSDVPAIKRVELFSSKWLFIAVAACACLEWLVRRLANLK